MGILARALGILMREHAYFLCAKWRKRPSMIQRWLWLISDISYPLLAGRAIRSGLGG
jgi:hypothetical protein